MLKLTERLGPIAASQATDTLTLPYELRIRGRLKATSDSGRELGLFLDRGPVLRDGEGLRAEDGAVVRIHAAVEPVVTARIAAGLPLARLAYHLGNRHVQLALGEDEPPSRGQGWVRFPPDHVLEELAELLGATLEHHEAPFDPEPGAYTQGGHSHGHSHPHGHAHDHDHDHAY
ncbi:MULTISPECIES: urease accessory protein UreE [Halomonas]|uniref:Urease accessory protein UreE n=1 Tax=Halomonas flagellata TaxID=2920385 RepID=A0ABS9RUI7_9GAMM|nr:MULTISPECIES: urease accessory protein UreE [Halomonas]MCH4563533.1 urease accessory protein UreE [Halomonas flagellata]PXX97575.1 urease accessory protein UreE [Halomonas sp. LBP4]